MPTAKILKGITMDDDMIETALVAASVTKVSGHEGTSQAFIEIAKAIKLYRRQAQALTPQCILSPVPRTQYQKEFTDKKLSPF